MRKMWVLATQSQMQMPPWIYKHNWWLADLMDERLGTKGYLLANK